jgi:hypothetical protein
VRWAVTVALVALASALAACGGGAPADQTPGVSASTTDDGGQAAALAVAGTVDCGGVRFDPETLDQAPDVSVLPAGPAAATDDAGAPAFGPDAGWRVVHVDDDRVDLVRELDEPMVLGAGDVRTHEVRRVERITGASNVPEGAWLLTLAGPCAARVVTEASDVLGDVDITLPSEPDPGSTTLDLLVWELACASGEAAHGRVVVVRFEETEDEVRVHLAVRPPEADFRTCPSNPPTPFSLPLSEPLGGRPVVDVSVSPPRVVVVDDGRLGVDQEPEEGVTIGAVEAALAWEPPTSYELVLETICMPCRDNVKRVTVVDGEVVERVAIDEDGEVVRPADADEAPSLAELQDRLRTVWEETPGGVLRVDVDVAGRPRYVDIDPDPSDDAGRLGFQVLSISER